MLDRLRPTTPLTRSAMSNLPVAPARHPTGRRAADGGVTSLSGIGLALPMMPVQPQVRQGRTAPPDPVAGCHLVP